MSWVHDEPKEGSPFASGKYPMFDPRYNIEFNEVINPIRASFSSTIAGTRPRPFPKRTEDGLSDPKHPRSVTSRVRVTLPLLLTKHSMRLCSLTTEKGYGIGRPETRTIRVPSTLNGRLRWSMCHHRV